MTHQNSTTGSTQSRSKEECFFKTSPTETLLMMVGNEQHKHPSKGCLFQATGVLSDVQLDQQADNGTNRILDFLTGQWRGRGKLMNTHPSDMGRGLMGCRF